MSSSNNVQVIHAYRVKFSAQQVRIAVFTLINNQMQCFASTAQLTGNFLVCHSQTSAAVHQQQHGVRFLDGHPDLTGH